MAKGQAVNGLILAGVVLVVAGVAWFRSNRGASPTLDATPAAGSSETLAASQGEDVARPARPGELCPETLPIARGPDTRPSETAAEAATTQPLTKLPRVVDLGADKCKACKDLAPILEELKKEYAGRVVVEFIDVWKNPAAGEPYRIRVIPTQIFFDREGKEVWRHEGFLPKAAFVERFAALGVK